MAYRDKHQVAAFTGLGFYRQYFGFTADAVADPQWLVKSLAAPETVRPCIGCNQGCFGNFYTNRALTCTVNPAAGREAELGAGTEQPAADPRRVAVGGGGPAGMVGP